MTAGPAPGDETRRRTAAIARGDEAALAMFYEEWFDRMYAMAGRLTRRDEAFCLDVVQDAMLRVVRSMRPMRDVAELSRWLARVVHTAALDLLRRESRRVARERNPSVTKPPSGARDTQSADLELSEQILWLRAALRTLAHEDRALLAMRYGQERSLDDAGATAGLSGDAAHGRIRRVLARLRQSAKGHFDERA